MTKPAPAAAPLNPGVTEAAAAVSWCPFSRAPLNIGPGAPMIAVNRTGVEIGGVPNGATCMGQACMVWAWAESVSPQTLEVVDDRDPAAPDHEQFPPARPPTVPPTWDYEALERDGAHLVKWTEPEAEAQARRRGRCGLASQ